MSTRSVAVAIVLALLTLAAAETPAGRTVRAADAATIPIASERTQHCHDARGGLSCFASVTERDADLEAALDDGLQALSSGGYVIAFVHATFAGSSVVLTQSYVNLGTIGWNDKISSYKVYTNLTGGFYKNAYYSGPFQQYCCLVQVSYVGDYFNDTFSSFYLP